MNYINITCYTFTRSVVINANSKKEEIKLNYDILNSMNETREHSLFYDSQIKFSGNISLDFVICLYENKNK